MLNRQLAFDTAVAAILAQGGPAIDPITKHCQYRAPHGKKCAVGHLIPDENYDRDFEGNGVFNINLGAIDSKFGIVDYNEDDDQFLAELQRVHDVQRFVSADRFAEKFKAEAEILADRFDLNKGVLN